MKKLLMVLMLFSGCVREGATEYVEVDKTISLRYWVYEVNGGLRPGWLAGQTGAVTSVSQLYAYWFYLKVTGLSR